MSTYSVVVFGEALVDIFKADVVVGGAPFNVARHLTGLQQPVYFITAIGDDNSADLIKKELENFQMNALGVQVLPQYKTGSVFVHETATGHHFEIMPNCAYDHIQLTPAISSYFKSHPISDPAQTILYHGSLCLRASDSFDTFGKLSQMIKKNGSQVFFDLNWRDGFLSNEVVTALIQQADYIKLSADELNMVLQWFYLDPVSSAILPEAGKRNLIISKLFKNLAAKYLFVTYGNLGSALFNHEGRCLCAQPTYLEKPVVDTVGAGDAFSSVVLLGLIQGWPVDTLLRRANQFAAEVCCIRGAVPSNLAFYQPFNNSWQTLAMQA